MTGRMRRVAVLGTGTMGAPMARNLAHAGYRVRVWNRTPAKAAALTADGAIPAYTPAEAADGAEVLITMLSDGRTVENVMTESDGALSTFAPGAIWLQMSTVGIEWADRLADLAARHGVVLVDAPVSGSSEPAERGELVVLAAGARQARQLVTPIFDVLGHRTVWLDSVGDGSRLKLALNNWLVVLVEGMSETLSFSDALGLPPDVFLETIAGGPLASAYAIAKGTAMLDGQFATGFPLRHAVKDAELAARAAHQHGMELSLTSARLRRWRRAILDGHGDDDVSSVITESVGAYPSPGNRRSSSPA